jgi:hypothetical protein
LFKRFEYGENEISNLFYIPFNEPTYLDIATDIIDKLLENDESVSVIFPNSRKSIVEFYSSSILRAGRREMPEDAFIKFCIKKNIKLFYVHQSRKVEIVDLLSNSNFCASLESSLISYFSDSGPFNGKRHELIRRKYIRLSTAIYTKTLEVLSAEAINRIYVPNGRMADQMAFILAAGEYDFKPYVTFFEKGLKANTYYIGDYSLLDRVAIQRSIGQSDHNSQILAATTFLESRRHNLEINEYINGWPANQNSGDECLPSKNVVLFNSSNDEFMSLGPDWNDSDWNSQWDAFSQITRYFLQNGYSVKMRMHPNGVNKSTRERARERNELNHFRKMFPKVQVFRPQEKINSYDLIKRADLVVVWNSTIGLEAAYMGKPVFTLNASEWDLSISNTRIRNAEDLEKLLDKLPKISVSLPIKFVAGRLSLDKPLISVYYKEHFAAAEKEDFFYRLAKVVAGSRKLKYRNFAKVFFSSNLNPVYIILKKLNYKLKNYG